VCLSQESNQIKKRKKTSTSPSSSPHSTLLNARVLSIYTYEPWPAAPPEPPQRPLRHAGGPRPPRHLRRAAHQEIHRRHRGREGVGGWHSLHSRGVRLDGYVDRTGCHQLLFVTVRPRVQGLSLPGLARVATPLPGGVRLVTWGPYRLSSIEPCFETMAK
jgi:hypothetical protein